MKFRLEIINNFCVEIFKWENKYFYSSWQNNITKDKWNKQIEEEEEKKQKSNEIIILHVWCMYLQ